MKLTPNQKLAEPLAGARPRIGDRFNAQLRHVAQSAFTLLEIMVALSLLSVIVIAIYSSWNSILKATRVGLDVSAAAQRTRISMRTLQDSLLCARMFNENSSYYGFVADTSGDFSSLSFVARLPQSFPRSGRFGVDVRRVSFTVEPNGPESKKCLVLRQCPLFVDPDKNEMETPLVLARDVAEFKLQFWDPKQGDWTTDWNATNQLPQMVQISLGLGRLDSYSSEPQQEIFAVVSIPGQAVRREWEIPQGGPAAPQLQQPGGTSGAGQNGNLGAGGNGTVKLQ